MGSNIYGTNLLSILPLIILMSSFGFVRNSVLFDVHSESLIIADPSVNFEIRSSFWRFSPLEKFGN